MSNYYDEIASGYDELHKEEQFKKFEVLKGDYELFNNVKTLLDVGCGTGFSLDFFPVETCVGIDPAAKLVEQYKGEHTIEVGSAEALPYGDGCFDVVISVTAIQNFDDIKKGLEEIRRVGKNKFGLTFLKHSAKAQRIEKLIDEVFADLQILRVEQEHDYIFIIEE